MTTAWASSAPGSIASDVVSLVFGDAVEFNVRGIVLLLSAVANRRANGMRTKFKLPRDPLARHILRLWRFPRAVEMVSRTPFRMLVERDDLQYFGVRIVRLLATERSSA
jgi:hypothetical protein